MEKAAHTEVGDEPVPTGTERILFIDGEQPLVEMGEEMLADLGYDLTCRTNSREVLALFKLDPSHFDLVITDQTMPEMTGMGACPGGSFHQNRHADHHGHRFQPPRRRGQGPRLRAYAPSS